MKKYDCGHEYKQVIVNRDVISNSEYCAWKESTGVDGDKSECYDCYCERIYEHCVRAGITKK